MRNFDLGQIQVSASSGLDALFEQEPKLVRPVKTMRRRVASLQDLDAFQRISSDTLIHKSDRDLWSIGKEADGSFYVQRLFDDHTPVKG